MSNLRALREAAGLRREELAAQARISYDYVRRLETVEGSNPTIGVARRIAAIFGVEVDEIFPPAQTSTQEPANDSASTNGSVYGG